MNLNEIQISDNKEISQQEVVKLYQASNWSAATKAELLYKALKNSDSLITARSRS